MPQSRSVARARSWITGSAALAVGGVVTLLAGSAGASGTANQPGNAPPELDAGVLADLSSIHHDVRVAATARLLDVRGLDPPTMLRLAREDRLPLEARYRLVTASFQTVVQAPLGALGVSTNREPDPRGLVVASTVTGFETERHLRSQDILVRVAGVDLRVQDDLASAVQQRRPGDRITVVFMRALRDEDGRVRRDPETTEILHGAPESVELRLGDFRDLESDGFTQARMSQAVAVQRRRDWTTAATALLPTPRRLEIPVAAEPALPEPPGGAPRVAPRGVLDDHPGGDIDHGAEG